MVPQRGKLLVRHVPLLASLGGGGRRGGRRGGGRSGCSSLFPLCCPSVLGDKVVAAIEDTVNIIPVVRSALVCGSE